MKTYHLLIIMLAALLLALLGCSSGRSNARLDYDFAKVEKIAVIDVVGNVGGEAAKNQIGDFFVMELLKKGYAPIERSQVQSLLDEQDFQASDLTSTEDAAKAGKILNVPAVLLINVPTFKEQMSITAKMINVEDGSILWLGTGSGSTGKTLATIFGAAAGAGAGVAATGDSDQVIGGVVGGVLGGVAGRALSPQVADKAQQIIGKICEDLPPRAQ